VDAVEEYVPGAAAGRQIINETIDMVPGRELLPCVPKAASLSFLSSACVV